MRVDVEGNESLHRFGCLEAQPHPSPELLMSGQRALPPFTLDRDEVFWSNLSAARASLKDWPAASAAAETAIGLKPRWAKAHARLAAAYTGQEDHVRVCGGGVMCAGCLFFCSPPRLAGTCRSIEVQ